MTPATALQFSALGKSLLRAAAWAVVTMALGLILVALFGGPIAASTPAGFKLPGKHHIKEKPGPWVYRNLSLPV